MSIAKSGPRTAMFLDIENLIGGYSGRGQLPPLSLREVYRRIDASPLTGAIAIRRAYANWAHPGLSMMRSEIVELGIDPVQIFGFSFGQHKNAADIQLTIDVAETVFTKGWIDTFVIVSGDGGYAAVAKKLREHGKIVLGCAWRKTINRVLESVCDDFLWLDAIADGETASDWATERSGGTAGGPLRGGSDPQVPLVFRGALARTSLPAQAETLDGAATFLRALCQSCQDDRHTRPLVMRDGIGMSQLRTLLSARVPGFDFTQHKFLKFAELCRYALAGSPFCLVQGVNGPSVHRRDSVAAEEGPVLPDLSAEEVRTPSLERYVAVLAHGQPPIRLPETLVVTAAAAGEIAARPTDDRELAWWIEEIYCVLDDHLSPSREQVKAMLLATAACGVFVRRPADRPLSEQSLSLAEGVATAADILGRLRAGCRDRIARFLGAVDDSLIDQLVPGGAGDGAGDGG